MKRLNELPQIGQWTPLPRSQTLRASVLTQMKARLPAARTPVHADSMMFKAPKC
jgi:hypothetical protein